MTTTLKTARPVQLAFDFADGYAPILLRPEPTPLADRPQASESAPGSMGTPRSDVPREEALALLQVASPRRR